MSPTVAAAKSSVICKTLVLLVPALCILYIFSSNHVCCKSSTSFTNSSQKRDPYVVDPNSPTNANHIVFAISGSTNTWNDKKGYVEAWWRPNVTRGRLFLDRPPTEFLPWPSTVDPPFCVSKDIRAVRLIAETYRAENRGVRWYVVAEDDTVLFVDNLAGVLGKYDHRKYYYVGGNSECIVPNEQESFGMAFGGAGFALSYPLTEALVENFDLCAERYPHLYDSGRILQACVADLGVSLTHEKGFHQIDLHGDIWGLLSAHPQSPLLSLHRLDTVKPIFPSMNHLESLNHLMKAAETDESRLLQQSICYDRNHHHNNNWTFSVSWGYSVQIYENIFPPSILQRPIETFSQWKKGAVPPYVFNTRAPSDDPREAPHVFFFDSVEEDATGGRRRRIVTKYTRRWPRRLPACSSDRNHSADRISKIHVLSPIRRLISGVGSRRECCDVLPGSYGNNTVINLRACLEDEMVV